MSYLSKRKEPPRFCWSVPEGEVYELFPQFPVTIQNPPHIIVVGCTKDSAIVAHPENWDDFKARFPTMTNAELRQKYFKCFNPRKLPRFYSLCHECGYNTVYQERCVRCKPASP